MTNNIGRNTQYAQNKLPDVIWQGIPHMSVSIKGLTFDAPVAVRHRKGATAMVAIECEQDEYGFIYALPGGGRINSIGTVLRWSK
jgi:hypothetical protein